MKIRPLRDYILVEVEPDASETPSGIIVLPAKEPARQFIATVIATGPGLTDDKGRLDPMPLEVGDRIAVSQHFIGCTPPGMPNHRLLRWPSCHYVVEP